MGAPAWAMEGKGPVSEKTKSKKWMWTWIGVGIAVLLAAAIYTGAYFIAGNRVPEKAAVGDIAIGGMSPRAAEEKIRQELEPTLSNPIEITTPHGAKAQIVPSEAGLGYDYEATLNAAGGGFSWNPADIVRAFSGGETVEPVRTVDEDKLKAAVAQHAEALRVEPKNASISLSEGEVSTTAGTVGYQLQAEQTAQKVREAFESNKATVEAAGEEANPGVTDEDIKAFQEGPLAKAMNGAVTLTTEGANVELTEEQVRQVLTITGEGKELGVGYDAAKLKELTDPQIGKLPGGPKNASYRLVEGGVEVVPAEKGMALGEEAVAKAFEKAINEGERTVALEATESEPEFTTEAAEKVKPKQVIGEFSTKYPHAQYRNVNIGKAAEMVNGTVLMPGQVFSLNDTLGERTTAAGWASGYVISGGNLVRQPGGGVSQAATTLFNASFFAGYEDVEHKPHSLYFNRYPAGREATVYYGAVDLKFRNDTDYPAVIQGFTSKSSPGKQGSVTFRIWSIPTYDKVESTDLVRSDYYSGRDRVLDTPDCEPQAPIQGFTVTWKRLFYKDGKVVREEPFRWKYNAGDRIRCS